MLVISLIYVCLSLLDISASGSLENENGETESEYHNGFIITWIFNQIIMYSDKVKLVVG